MLLCQRKALTAATRFSAGTFAFELSAVPLQGQYDCLIVYMNNRLSAVSAVLLYMLPSSAPGFLLIFYIIFDLLVLHFSCTHLTPLVHMTAVQ